MAFINLSPFNDFCKNNHLPAGNVFTLNRISIAFSQIAGKQNQNKRA